MEGTKVKEDETLPEGEEKELWMKSEAEGDEVVPAATHIRIKQKLRGRLGEKDDKILELERTVADLKSKVTTDQQQQTPEHTAKPKRADYESDDDYFDAVDRYFDKSMESRYERIDRQKQQDRHVNTFRQSQEKAVNDHYDRAANLLQETGIDAELYQNADVSVREAVNAVMKGKGDQVTDQLIANMGVGSEKVVYFLGRNPSALAEFKALLAEDSSGIKASIYLGTKKAELTKPQRMRSNAPPPPSELPGGDAQGGVDGHIDASNAKRKYDAAHKAGKTGEAIKIKFKAKRSGVDTSGW